MAWYFAVYRGNLFIEWSGWTIFVTVVCHCNGRFMISGPPLSTGDWIYFNNANRWWSNKNGCLSGNTMTSFYMAPKSWANLWRCFVFQMNCLVAMYCVKTEERALSMVSESTVNVQLVTMGLAVKVKVYWHAPLKSAFFLPFKNSLKPLIWCRSHFILKYVHMLDIRM